MAIGTKVRVGVVFGGRSGEHEVSLVSAQSIIKALQQNDYDVVPIGINKSGGWLVGAEPQNLLTDQGRAGQITMSGQPSVLGDPTHGGLVLLDQNRPFEKIKLDVIFPIVHGTYGEDGTLQGLLELADLPYVGCGVLASAIGMDKTAAKRMFRDAGLYVPHFREVLRAEWRKDPDRIIDLIEKEFPYPCFVKPVNAGSSVGVSKARDREQLIKAINEAARFDRKMLIETFVKGRELEVSVLGNDEPIASIPGEIVPCNEFYDYQAKYIDDRSELKIPAPLSPEKSDEIRRMAVTAFRAIDGAGMARVDFFYETESGRLVINEVNTIPGFTSISMYPKLWEASGISYPDLVRRLVELAQERYNERQETLKTIAS